jgi:hypothetical protein
MRNNEFMSRNKAHAQILIVPVGRRCKPKMLESTAVDL